MLEKLINNVKRKYRFFSQNESYYRNVCNKYIYLPYDEALSLINEEILFQIRMDWESQKRKWITDFINETCILYSSRNLNTRYLSFIIKILATYQIPINEETVLYLLKKCPTLHRLVSSFNNLSHNREVDAFIAYCKGESQSKMVVEEKRVLSTSDKETLFRQMVESRQMGDEENYNRLKELVVEQLNIIVYRYALRYVGYGISYEDLVQEGKLLLLQKLECRNESYFFLHAFLRALQWKFKRMIKRNSLDNAKVPTSFPLDENTETTIKNLKKAIDNLPERNRKTVLHYYEVFGEPFKSRGQLANEDNITCQAVQQRLAKGISSLKVALSKPEEVPPLQKGLKCTSLEFELIISSLSQKEQELLARAAGNQFVEEINIREFTEEEIKQYLDILAKLRKELIAIRNYGKKDIRKEISTRKKDRDRIQLFLQLYPDIPSKEDKKSYHSYILRARHYLKQERTLRNVLDYPLTEGDLYYALKDIPQIYGILCRVFGKYLTKVEKQYNLTEAEKRTYNILLLKVKEIMNQYMMTKVDKIVIINGNIQMFHQDVLLPFNNDIMHMIKQKLRAKGSTRIFDAYLLGKSIEEIAAENNLKEDQVIDSLFYTIELMKKIVRPLGIFVAIDIPIRDSILARKKPE